MEYESHEVERCRKLLRQKMSDQGYTQQSVQEPLGWGKTSISQMLNGRKRLRFEHILAILRVIDIHPSEFFAELYPEQQEEAHRVLADFAGLLLAKGLLTQQELLSFAEGSDLAQYL